MKLLANIVPQACFGSPQACFWRGLGASGASLGRNLGALGELLGSLGCLFAASWAPFGCCLGNPPLSICNVAVLRVWYCMFLNVFVCFGVCSSCAPLGEHLAGSGWLSFAGSGLVWLWLWFLALVLVLGFGFWLCCCLLCVCFCLYSCFCFASLYFLFA